MATPSRFLPGASHGQRSLVGYSLGRHTESDATEVTQHHTACVYKTYGMGLTAQGNKQGFAGQLLKLQVVTEQSLKMLYLGLSWWLSGEESGCQCKRDRLDP